MIQSLRGFPIVPIAGLGLAAVHQELHKILHQKGLLLGWPHRCDLVKQIAPLIDQEMELLGALHLDHI